MRTPASEQGLRLGQRVAPPRFVLFVLLFIVGLTVAIPTLGLGRGTLAAFDVAAAVFLVSLWGLFRRGEAQLMRRAARENDANRALLLAITGTVTLVVLVAVFKELQAKGDPMTVPLVIATLVLAWLFSNMVYAFHYAHLYYGDADHDGADNKGIDFPKTDEPDYWDFVYFSFTLGMTFQTSDCDVTASRIRRVMIGHTLAAYVYSIGVLAFTINVLGGGK